MPENNLMGQGNENLTPQIDESIIGQMGPTDEGPQAKTTAQPEAAEPTMEELAMMQNASAQPAQQMAEELNSQINRVHVKEFEQLSRAPQPPQQQNIDLLLDVTLPVSIELGRTAMSIENVLNLGPGSVVELDRLAGEPVDLLVNEKLIAWGEVVVVDENFGIRITSMVSPQDRIKSLK
jgi:flagellar motor switch protein FliN